MNENKGKKKGKGGGAAKGGGGAKGGSHVNIKNAPISLRDGDDIGVKVSLWVGEHLWLP